MNAQQFHSEVIDLYWSKLNPPTVEQPVTSTVSDETINALLEGKPIKMHCINLHCRSQLFNQKHIYTVTGEELSEGGGIVNCDYCDNPLIAV